jgi:DNA-binding SARP family transcriptional activator/tetratricopeptide (TPR) repeat protein
MTGPDGTDEPARCRLFGAFAIEGPAGAVRLRARRSRALVAYLAFAGPAGASRERLSGLLWTDRGEEQARASLRQCLLELKRELADAGMDEALEVGRQQVALKPGSLVTDVQTLEAAIRGRDTAAMVSALRDLDGKTLLEDAAVGGLFDDWLARTRAQLDSTLERETHRTLEATEARGAWTEVRDLAEAFLLRSPTDETVAAAAIRADMAMGVTSAAHRRFRALESTLASEFGLRPGESVSRALEAPFADPTPRPVAGAVAVSPTATRPALGAGTAASRPLVVVGAFEGATTEAATTLAETLRDEVISGLARFRDLSVAADPQPSSSLDAGAFADPQLVFALGARMRPGSRPGITVQIMHLLDRNVVWSETFDVPDTSILQATDLIVARAVGAVLPSIDLALAQPHRQRMEGSCYLAYLDAARRARTAPNHEAALSAAADLRDLIAAEPSFVLPYLPLAYLYNTDFNYTRACSSDADRYREALDLAKTAMNLDRRHNHGYIIAGWSYLRMHRWDAALGLFEQALNLNQYNPGRLMQIGFGFLFLDQPDRARELLNRCLLVNPTPEDDYFIDLGLLELVCGNHDRARTYFDLVARPTIWGAIYPAVNAELSGQPQPGAAEAALSRIAAIWPADRPMTEDAVIEWMLQHKPFQSDAARERFVSGARRMLGPVSSLASPA